MFLLSTVLVVFVSLMHFYFLVLEMFLWTKPLGLKVFRMSLEKAQTTKSLAQNQGLYNGFLAAGLLYGVCVPNVQIAMSFKLFFLVCVVIAGLVGALTVAKRIFYIQSLPAIVAFIFVILSKV